MIILFLLLGSSLGLTLITYFFSGIYQTWWCWLLAPLMWIGFFVGTVIVMALYFGFFSLFVDLEKDEKKPKWYAHWTIAQISQVILPLFGAITHVSGLDKLPKDKRFVLVCNHLSNMDHLIFLAKMRKYHIVSISKPETERFFVAGKWSHMAGFIPIDRNNAFNAVKSIVRAANYVKKDIASIAISPEGTRSKDGQLHEFHAGSFKIVEKANCPLVVVSFMYTDKIKTRMFKGTHIYCDVVEVLDEKTTANMSTVEMAEKSMSLIQNNIDSHSQRKYII